MIGFRAFAACLVRSLFPRPGDPVRRTPFRLFATFVLLPMCLALWLVHQVGWLLDNIFFRGYRRTPVKRPLFVVGPPRCGTTFLHRALARDTDTFTSFTLGEMIFAPSITEKYVLSVFGRIDRALGAPVGRRIRRAEARGLHELNEMHWVSFFEPEEDYVLLAYLFANQLLIAMFPFPDILGPLWRFDDEMPAREKERMLTFYRRCVQRHLFYHGPEKVFLSKNPYFTPMIHGLAAAFPDARFVCNLRDPLDALPSMLGLWRVFYGSFGSDPEHYMARDFVVDYMADFYRRAAEAQERLPEERLALVAYDALIEDTPATIRALYAQFGYRYADAYDVRLREESKQTGKHKSRRQYDLEEFGLNPAAIAERFRTEPPAE